MPHKEKQEYIEWFKQKTKNFTIEISKFCNSLVKNPASDIIAKQLIKSSTSTSANYRAACRARSRAEFFSKISIVVEEADESNFWLSVVKEAGLFPDEKHLDTLLKESEIILSLSSRARKTTQKNSK